jgi:hypothetical protein
VCGGRELWKISDQFRPDFKTSLKWIRVQNRKKLLRRQLAWLSFWKFSLDIYTIKRGRKAAGAASKHFCWGRAKIRMMRLRYTLVQTKMSTVNMSASFDMPSSLKSLFLLMHISCFISWHKNGLFVWIVNFFNQRPQFFFLKGRWHVILDLCFFQQTTPPRMIQNTVFFMRKSDLAAYGTAVASLWLWTSYLIGSGSWLLLNRISIKKTYMGKLSHNFPKKNMEVN